MLSVAKRNSTKYECLEQALSILRLRKKELKFELKQEYHFKLNAYSGSHGLQVAQVIHITCPNDPLPIKESIS